METASPLSVHYWKSPNLLLRRRWPWHVLFWTGYILFRLWLYYITVKYYRSIYLEYMLISELMFIAATYLTLWLYRQLFSREKYFLYFLAGTVSWTLYLGGRMLFQRYYLQREPSFRGGDFTEMFLSNITLVIASFLFITACKYFKDGYITQQSEAEKRERHLLAEVNNLKSQIAPHFLFNTLNNLYGLAVDKSDKLPHLMLRLSDLLRHSLYETQKPLVPVREEIEVLKSYVELERVRLEDDLELQFEDRVPEGSGHSIAPLLLIVFVENAFKHARLVQGVAVNIYIECTLENNWFSFIVRNNYNCGKESSTNGIGLSNVKRRLEVLYPHWRHQLTISRDENFHVVHLGLQLTATAKHRTHGK